MVASLIYSQLLIIQTFKGNRKKFELLGVRVIEGKNNYVENVLKGNENCFELACDTTGSLLYVFWLCLIYMLQQA